MKAKCESALFDADCVGDHRVTRRSPDAFADAIRQSNREHLTPRLCKRKQRPRDRSQRVTRNHEQLSFRESIAEITREQLQQARDRLGESLDDSDRARRSTQTSGQENGQQWIDDLARRIVEQTHQSNRNHIAWQSAIAPPQAVDVAMICCNWLTMVLMLP